MFYLFGTAIILGAAIAFLRLRGQIFPPWSLTILEGMFAIGGLIWMFVIAIDKENRTSHVTGPLIVFCVAAVLGFILLSYHIRKQALPIPLVIAHGIIALGAFVWLLA